MSTILTAEKEANMTAESILPQKDDEKNAFERFLAGCNRRIRRIAEFQSVKDMVSLKTYIKETCKAVGLARLAGFALLLGIIAVAIAIAVYAAMVWPLVAVIVVGLVVCVAIVRYVRRHLAARKNATPAS